MSVVNKLKSKIGVNNSEYSKNIFSIFTASTISQLIPLVTAPILLRLYSPSDYGYLGIFMAIVGLAGIVATLSYVSAIILAETEKEANAIVALCFKITFALVAVTAILLLIGYNFLVNFYEIKENKYLFLLVPFGILLNSGANIIATLATWHKQFKILSINRVAAAIVSAITSIIFGLLFKNVAGLFIGYFIGQIISTVVFYLQLQKRTTILPIKNYVSIGTKQVAKKHINFPKFVLPSDFINNFSNQIPIFLISTYAALPQVAIGFYNTTNRMLGLPITLISASISDVFRQRAAADYNSTGTCRPIFLKTFKLLFLSGIVPFAILIFFGADIFAFAFGEKWRGAGEYSQILGLLFFVRYVVSPLTYVFYIANKQKLDFYLHLLFVVIGFVSLYFGFKVYNDVHISLWIFSISYCCLYLVYLYFSYKYSKNI